MKMPSQTHSNSKFVTNIHFCGTGIGIHDSRIFFSVWAWVQKLSQNSSAWQPVPSPSAASVCSWRLGGRRRSAAGPHPSSPRPRRNLSLRPPWWVLGQRRRSSICCLGLLGLTSEFEYLWDFKILFTVKMCRRAKKVLNERGLQVASKLHRQSGPLANELTY